MWWTGHPYPTFSDISLCFTTLELKLMVVVMFIRIGRIYTQNITQQTFSWPLTYLWVEQWSEHDRRDMNLRSIFGLNTFCVFLLTGWCKKKASLCGLLLVLTLLYHSRALSVLVLFCWKLEKMIVMDGTLKTWRTGHIENVHKMGNS